MSCLFFPSSPWVPMLSVGYLVCFICQCILQISLKRSYPDKLVMFLFWEVGWDSCCSPLQRCTACSTALGLFSVLLPGWGDADKSPPERLIPGALTSKHLSHSNAFISRENNFPGAVGQLVETLEEEVGPRDLRCSSHIAPSKPFTIF